MYRAIDRDGNLVDSLLSAKRDMAAAQHFFRSAQSMAMQPPTRVTTDGHDAYPRAIREVLGESVMHRNGWYCHRCIERDHRHVKQHYYPMLGHMAFASAQRFWQAYEELRQYLRPRRKHNQVVSLRQRRHQFTTQVQALTVLFQAT